MWCVFGFLCIRRQQLQQRVKQLCMGGGDLLPQTGIFTEIPVILQMVGVFAAVTVKKNNAIVMAVRIAGRGLDIATGIGPAKKIQQRIYLLGLGVDLCLLTHTLVKGQLCVDHISAAARFCLDAKRNKQKRAKQKK